MQSNFDYMMSKCPWWLKKNDNVQAFYKAVSKLFDEVDKTYNLLEKQHLVDYADGDFLDDVGAKFEVQRHGQDDERYRNRIRLEMMRYKLVPNIETLYKICQMFTGIAPTIDFNENNEPAQYKVTFLSGENFNFSLVDELNLENIVGGGIKINTQKYLDNYNVGMRFGDRHLSEEKIKNYIKRNPINITK